MPNKLLICSVLLSLWVLPASAQVSVPFNDFLPGQIISSGEANANFAAIADNALNRTGGTITGHITVDPNVTIDSADISIFLTISRVRAQTLGTVGAPAFSVSTETTTGIYTPSAGQLALSLAGTQRLLLNNGLTIYGNSEFNSAGKIPALTSTYFGLTDAQELQIAEPGIVDGALLARVAANETITGQYDFDFLLQSAPTWNNAAVIFRAFDINVTNTASAAASKLVDWRVGGASKASVDVAGKFVPTALQVTSGARNQFVLVGDANGNGQWIETASTAPVPAGMVAFFEAACPTGWTRRALYDSKFLRGGATFDSVGGGSDAAHTHSVDPPNTTSNSAGGHSHTVDYPATTTTSAGDHNHTWGGSNTGSMSNDGSHTHTVDPGLVTSDGGTNDFDFPDRSVGDISLATSGHTHDFDIPATTTGSAGGHVHLTPGQFTTTTGAHTHTADPASLSTSTDGAATHTVDIASFTSGGTAAIPAYIQVVVCKKD